jgi:hypothetical protein
MLSLVNGENVNLECVIRVSKIAIGKPLSRESDGAYPMDIARVSSGLLRLEFWKDFP